MSESDAPLVAADDITPRPTAKTTRKRTRRIALAVAAAIVAAAAAVAAVAWWETRSADPERKEIFAGVEDPRAPINSMPTKPEDHQQEPQDEVFEEKSLDEFRKSFDRIAAKAVADADNDRRIWHQALRAVESRSGGHVRVRRRSAEIAAFAETVRSALAEGTGGECGGAFRLGDDSRS